MTEDRKSESLGLFLPPEPPPATSATEVVAAVLAVAWVGAVLSYTVFAPPSGDGGMLGMVMVLLVVFLPLALIWTAMTTLRSVRVLRAEAARLQASVDAMRNAYLMGQHAAAVRPYAEARLEEGDASGGMTPFQTRRDPAGVVPSADRRAAFILSKAEVGPEEQPALALGTPAEVMERKPIAAADFIRALDFPNGPDDAEGFRALRAALGDRDVARLIRSAQDVLTLLSQEGIYMDDLPPDRARPGIWRQFATGERGRAIADLGGIRDRTAVALTVTRMREDPVFKDAGHHFLRTFDQVFQDFETRASDAELAAFAETRTARAFMLFGRVTGIFD